MNKFPEIKKPSPSEDELVAGIAAAGIVGASDTVAQFLTQNVEYRTSATQPIPVADLHFNYPELGVTTGMGALISAGLTIAVRIAVYRRRMGVRNIEIEDEVKNFRVAMTKELGSTEAEEPKIL